MKIEKSIQTEATSANDMEFSTAQNELNILVTQKDLEQSSKVNEDKLSNIRTLYKDC